MTVLNIYVKACSTFCYSLNLNCLFLVGPKALKMLFWGPEGKKTVEIPEGNKQYIPKQNDDIQFIMNVLQKVKF